MGCSSGFGDLFSQIMRKSDVAKGEPDNNEAHFGHFVIGLLLVAPTLWVVVFMGLFAWAHIGLLAPIVIIGTALWACGYYGTNRSILDRFRYRTTAAQRARIRRRLSGENKS